MNRIGAMQAWAHVRGYPDAVAAQVWLRVSHDEVLKWCDIAALAQLLTDEMLAHMRPT